MVKEFSSFEKAVYAAARRIPKGRVSTYGAIAVRIGKPGAARAVGNTLNKNPYAPEVPCHRVVNSDGRLGGFARGSLEKKKLLNKEGIIVSDGKIKDFNKVQYNF